MEYKKLLHDKLESGFDLFYIIKSEEFRKTLTIEFDEFKQTSPSSASSFFFNNPIDSYQEILAILNNHDEKKYIAVHKGTPFYFISIASFIKRDYEKAVYFMNAAVAEDLRNNVNYDESPAQMFFSLNSEYVEFNGSKVVQEIRENILIQINKYENLNIDQLINQFILKIILKDNTFSSIATAFFSYHLEYSQRIFELKLVKEKISKEPQVMHLVKGTLLFESMIRKSQILKEILSKEDKPKKFYNLKEMLEKLQKKNKI